jgi:hypothetical protein
MSATCEAQEGKIEGTDRAALLLMLSYVEAECRRIGAFDAARHAAQAAALLPDLGLGDVAAAGQTRPAGSQRLH